MRRGGAYGHGQAERMYTYKRAEARIARVVHSDYCVASGGTFRTDRKRAWTRLYLLVKQLAMYASRAHI